MPQRHEGTKAHEDFFVNLRALVPLWQKDWFFFNEHKAELQTGKNTLYMQPILTADLFLPLQQELISLLRSLAPDDWQRPTIAGSWRVKDVVAHLLDTDLRRLSSHRDGYSPKPSAAIETYGELVAFLNDLNRTWVDAAERLSPNVLTELLAWTGPQVAEFFISLPPDGEAKIGVAWAGEQRSQNWMDVGREYTEKWHHQAQIRDAVGAPGLMSRRWLSPVLELAMYALPYTFRDTAAPDGSALSINIDGEAGGQWYLIREGNGWRLRAGETANPAARVSMSADTAWRLFFNGLKLADAGQRVTMAGDASLCATFITTRSVMV